MTGSRRGRRWGALAIAAWVTSVGAHVAISGRTASAASIATGDTTPLRIDDALGTLSFAGRAPIALSPDGELVAYTLLDARRRESTTDERYAYYTRTGAPVEAAGSDVWIANVKTAEMKTLTGAQGTSWAPAWSPDGQRIAFTAYKGFAPNTQQVFFDLDVIGLRDAEPHVIVPTMMTEYGLSVSWSPDGRQLAYTTAGQKADGRCFVVPSAGGVPRPIEADGRPSFSDDHRAPLWDRAGRHLYVLSAGALWSADVDGGGAAEKLVEIDGHSIREIVSPAGGGRFWSPKDDGTLVVSTLDRATRRAGFFRIDPATSKVTPIVEEDKIYAGIFGMDAQSQTLVYAAQDAQHPPDLWVSNDAFSSRRRVTWTNPQLESYVFGGSRLIAWRTADGRVLHGAVLLPPDFREGVRYPLIVNVYGGSIGSNNVNRFGLVGSTIDNQQLLATRGYVVFAPDIPIQTGTPMRDIAAAVLPGVDEVVRLGLADPQRLGVMGHSYGGYSTLALIVQTTTFRAAVASAAQADLVIAWFDQHLGPPAGSRG